LSGILLDHSRLDGGTGVCIRGDVRDLCPRKRKEKEEDCAREFANGGNNMISKSKRRLG
jgi:hypothetical protein